MKSITAYYGKEQFIKYYQALEKELKRGDFYYAFAFQNEYQSPEVKKFLKQFHGKIAKKKIDDRAIFDQKIESIARKTYESNENIKLKFKNFNIPVGLVVTKNRIMQLGWRPEPFIVEIKNSILFKHYYEFFLENWNSNEAIEYAKEAFMKLACKYNYNVLNKINNLRDCKRAILAAESIEKIENRWKYQYNGKEKKFGQKKIGETIKLWSVPRTTAELLEFFVAATGSKNILEIGTSAGYSTLYLAMGAYYSNGRVLTIEKLKPKIKIAKSNFKKSGMKNIKLLEGDALEILKNKKLGKFDLVFLDADKENYGKYFEMVMPLLKKGGFIIADNVYDYGHMMQDYLNRVLGTKLPNSRSDKRVKSYTLPIDNGVIITRKLKDR